MTFEILTSPVDGVSELRCYPFRDERGSFLNVYRKQEPAFSEIWGDREICQVNHSLTADIGVVRGLHLQTYPFCEAKLVRCLRGCVWDVAVDLRTKSPTFGKWHAVELSPRSANALLIPEGCAHGFQVLEKNSELLYIHSAPWSSLAEYGVRYDDPQLAISWPLSPMGLSERDLSLPFL